MAVSYATQIKPLFTEMDRDHMLKVRFIKLDLWSYDSVKAVATEILDAVSAGSMPPPGTEPSAPWTQDKVQLFQQWINDGMEP